MRKATIRISDSLGLIVISIHTFLAEGDSRVRLTSFLFVHFNPHLPCGRRLPPCPVQTSISYFNPHLPCGRRQQLYHLSFGQKNFNPHLPCGRRLPSMLSKRSVAVFQSTPSLRKATTLPYNRFRPCFHFNPHLPCGRRPGQS